MPYHDFSLSSYLTFRYLVDGAACWRAGLAPGLPSLDPGEQRAVRDAREIRSALEEIVAGMGDLGATGILLSGGIDSAILARLLPAGTKAYTIRFVAPGAVDEVPMARRYAETCALHHREVAVTWEQHLECMDQLMLRKKSPLHAIEVALYQAALAARADGVERLVVGNGADSTFGGMDKLLSRDYTLEQFVERYSFVNPERALKRPVSMLPVFARYCPGEWFDTAAFLKTVHGIGIVQSFENAIGAAGCAIAAPYEELCLEGELDLARIRNGESKYLLRQVFADLYPGLEAPDKIPFARPMERWLAEWQGPRREEFRDQLDLGSFSGDQKWLIYCLERFLNLCEVKA